MSAPIIRPPAQSFQKRDLHSQPKHPRERERERGWGPKTHITCLWPSNLPTQAKMDDTPSDPFSSFHDSCPSDGNACTPIGLLIVHVFVLRVANLRLLCAETAARQFRLVLLVHKKATRPLTVSTTPSPRVRAGDGSSAVRRGAHLCEREPLCRRGRPPSRSGSIPRAPSPPPRGTPSPSTSSSSCPTSPP